MRHLINLILTTAMVFACYGAIDPSEAERTLRQIASAAAAHMR